MRVHMYMCGPDFGTYPGSRVPFIPLLAFSPSCHLVVFFVLFVCFFFGEGGYF